jgi:hypothetical protein
MQIFIWTLFALIVILQLLDVVSTLRAFHAGAIEGNPIVAWLIDKAGVIPGLVMAKATTLAGVLAVMILAPSPWPVMLLLVVSAGYAWVVINNLRHGR